MFGEQLGEIGEGRVAAGQIVQRCVAGVARIMMLAAPAPAGLVVLREGADRMREFGRAGPSSPSSAS